ncbi:SPASM domain-containing protein [Pseudomonas putida]|uniref:SPASM domain-containing protein n=1 Tax=Pseudomonas putida TaxID=303 RepID=A0A7V8EGH4_PSEPU|nr:SPASM domain-containing protein [Pseudomonas putida]
MVDRLQGNLTPKVDWIWHGGEPMLMGPDFFRACAEYADAQGVKLNFAIQTNLLSYTSARWRDVFENVFEGRISTSFDPYKNYRTVKGRADTYDRLFWRAMDDVIADGFRPLVIGVYDEGAADRAMNMFDRAKAYGNFGFDIRFNYAYPAGRAREAGVLIQPKTYGHMLIDLYNRWIDEVPAFNITPLDQMLHKVAGFRTLLCPWTKSCGGKFLTIDPDGTVFNCSEFSDLADPAHRFGNILTGGVQVASQPVEVKFYTGADVVPALSMSPASREIIGRSRNVPPDCKTCRHFQECQGGCARDAVLFERGMGGKFAYCQSWKMVFDRLKESVVSGEADRILYRLGIDPVSARYRVEMSGAA